MLLYNTVVFSTAHA